MTEVSDTPIYHEAVEEVIGTELVIGVPEGVERTEAHLYATAWLDIAIEWLPGGDYIILISDGETPEGAPNVVHAIYNSVDEFYTFRGRLEEMEKDEIIAELEETRSEYARRVALGWGSWVRGDNIVDREERARARAAEQKEN